MWRVLLGMADVSATDWRKRLQRASAWLSWLLEEVLAASTAVSPWLVRGGWRRILLIDGTHLSCPGPLGMVWRGHTAFFPAFGSPPPTERGGPARKGTGVGRLAPR